MQGHEDGHPEGMHAYQALEDHLNQDQQWGEMEVRQVNSQKKKHQGSIDEKSGEGERVYTSPW
jgi:hypothetical protein